MPIKSCLVRPSAPTSGHILHCKFNGPTVWCQSDVSGARLWTLIGSGQWATYGFMIAPPILVTYHEFSSVVMWLRTHLKPLSQSHEQGQTHSTTWSPGIQGSHFVVKGRGCCSHQLLQRKEKSSTNHSICWNRVMPKVIGLYCLARRYPPITISLIQCLITNLLCDRWSSSLDGWWQLMASLILSFLAQRDQECSTLPIMPETPVWWCHHSKLSWSDLQWPESSAVKINPVRRQRARASFKRDGFTSASHWNSMVSHLCPFDPLRSQSIWYLY